MTRTSRHPDARPLARACAGGPPLRACLGRLHRRGQAGPRPGRLARRDHARLGALRHCARRAPHPRRPLLAGGRARRVRRQRHRRRLARGRGGHHGRQHSRRRPRRAPGPPDRLHAGSRPRPIGARARHRRRPALDDRQRHERRHRPDHRGRDRGSVRHGLGPVVVRGRDRRAHGRARAARALRVAPHPAHAPAGRRRARPPGCRRRRERDRVPRRRLAVPVPHLPAAPVGSTQLPAGRRRFRVVPRRRDRDVGRRRGADPARRRHRDRASAARAGALRRRGGEHPRGRRHAGRARGRAQGARPDGRAPE